MSLSTNDILAAGEKLLPILETIVGVMAPESLKILFVGEKIAQGVLAAVPEAEALYARIQSGDVPTQAELDAYATAEDGAYAALMAKIAAAQPQ